MANLKEFEALNLSTDVLKALEGMNIHTPTTVQQETIPLMMAGRDIIGIAPTGTGKTIAFGIPMLEYISLTEERVQEVVLAPTRELALQIAQELTSLAHFIPKIRIATLFRTAPEAFLRMIVVHELAHLRVREHDKAFYQLCQHMEPDYHQYEFDLRTYLAYRDAGGEAIWEA